MRRIMIYMALFILALLIPANRTDLGKMKPVEVIYVYREGEQIVISTDTADLGRGEDIHDALENLKESTPGIIYLDTADYLLITPDTEHKIPDLAGKLKGSVRICMTEGEIDVQQAGTYLSVHRPQKKLQDWKMGDPIQILVPEGDSMLLQ